MFDSVFLSCDNSGFGWIPVVAILWPCNIHIRVEQHCWLTDVMQTALPMLLLGLCISFRLQVCADTYYLDPA